MFYVVLAHTNAFIVDTYMYENYKEFTLGVNGKPGKRLLWDKGMHSLGRTPMSYCTNAYG